MMLRCKAVASVVLFACGSGVFAATINVPGDQATIQAGIDAAVSGVDEVVVADGTYNEIIDFGGKAITVRSVNGAGVTTIDATGVADPGDGLPVVRCDSGEGADTVLDGFTITGGTGDTVASPGLSFGGGMFNNGSSPTVSHCIFSGNTADSGGGMFNVGGGPTVTNCTFSGNTATNASGGMGNTSSSPTVTNCTFSGNSTAFGGGMTGSNGSLTVTNCTFSGNTATADGGGMWLFDGSPTVANCIFWGNLDIGGMDESAQIHTFSGTPVVNYSDVQGGWSGSGGHNINADPLFVDADGADNTVGTVDDDLRLSAGSPCIDAGISIAGNLTDLDGNSRLVDDPATADTGLGSPPIDMGAYEFGSVMPINRADFDNDGDVDGVDFGTFASCFNKAGNPPRMLGCPQ